jgi:YidC/Oxa1 family membrane protein insertase
MSDLKDQYRLEEISPGLDLTVDYGFLWWLAQPLFFLLDTIHSMVGNWGIAIIGLTILVKTLLFPLSAAGFKSMAKMRKLQPEMARLKERFGDDKQKFSQAMMELYKKEGRQPIRWVFPYSIADASISGIVLGPNGKCGVAPGALLFFG